MQVPGQPELRSKIQPLKKVLAVLLEDLSLFLVSIQGDQGTDVLLGFHRQQHTDSRHTHGGRALLNTTEGVSPQAVFLHCSAFEFLLGFLS